METLKTDITIFGAGLSGLAIAHNLKKQGKSVLIIEQDSRPGGVIYTNTEDGFIFESGPNTGVFSSPALVTLFDDLKDSCTLETAKQSAKKRYILKNSKWEALPSGVASAVTTPLFTLGDKFRILGEPFRKPGNNPDETLAELVRRRMGKSFLDYAVDPFISGVYAGDPEIIIPRYALPKLYALEQNYGSFVKGAIKKAKEPKTELQKRATGEVFSAKGGLYNLITALYEKIGKNNFYFNIKHSFVKPAGNGFEVSFQTPDGKQLTLNSRTVITTFGGEGIKNILPFVSEDLLSPIVNVRYAAVVQAAAGYKTWTGKKLDAFGGLVPSKEKQDFLGILFPSAIFEGRAPEKGALLSVFLGGIKKPDTINKSDSEIKNTVLKAIRETLYSSDEPDLFKIFRYHHAIPQYEKSTGERLASILEIEKMYPGLIIAGNIRDGIGMSDRVKQSANIQV